MSIPLPSSPPLPSRPCIFAVAWLLGLAPVLAPGADRGAAPPRPPAAAPATPAAAPATPDAADRHAAQEIQRLSASDTDRKIRKFAEMVLLPGGIVLVLVLLVRRNFLQ